MNGKMQRPLDGCKKEANGDDDQCGLTDIDIEAKQQVLLIFEHMKAEISASTMSRPPQLAATLGKRSAS